MAMPLLLRQQRHWRLGTGHKPALQLRFRAGTHRQHAQLPGQRVIGGDASQGSGDRACRQS
jgi:hypothetical protein